MKRLMVILIILMGFAPVFGQDKMETNEDVITAKMKLHALDKLRSLQRWDRDVTIYRRKFKESFTKDAILQNDIIPDNKLNQKIPIDSYIMKVDSLLAETPLFTIKPYSVKKQSVEETYDGWLGQFDIEAVKAISSCIPSDRHFVYSQTFLIKASIRVLYRLKYDSVRTEYYEEYTAKIRSILFCKGEATGKYVWLSCERKLPYSQKLKPVDSILVNGKIYDEKSTDRDSKGRFLVRNISESNEVTISSPDEFLIGGTTLKYNDDKILSSYNTIPTVHVIFQKPIPFFSFSYGINGLSKMSPFRSELTSRMSTLILQQRLSLAFGNHLHINSNGFWSVQLGLEWMHIQQQMELDDGMVEFSYDDSVGHSHTRTASWTNFSENQSIHYLSIPLTVQRGIGVGPRTIVTIGTGLAYNRYTVGTRISNAQMTYSGFYHDLFRIHIRENGVYDFGTFPVDAESSIPFPKPFSTYRFSIGFQRKISRKIHLTINYMFERGRLQYPSESKIISRNHSELLSGEDLGARYTIQSSTLHIGLKYWL